MSSEPGKNRSKPLITIMCKFPMALPLRDSRGERGDTATMEEAEERKNRDKWKDKRVERIRI